MRRLSLIVAVGFVVALAPTSTATAAGWTSVALMPTARAGLAAATAPDGRIYAIGGGIPQTGTSFKTVEAYTPGTNSWTTAASMSTARSNLAAAMGHDGRIYAMGGNGPCIDFSAVEAYTPATNRWTTMASMPTAREGLAAATGPDGRIYAIGGGNSCSGSVLNTVEAYTPASNRWASVASMPTARFDLAAATGSDGRIYAIGGNTGNFGLNFDLNTVEAYTPATNSWAAVAPLPTPRSGLAAATGPDGRIYAMGGDGVDAYTPGNNSWSAVASMQTARSNLAAATGRDGRIYAIGGAGQTAVVHAAEAYDTTVTTQPTPVATSNAARPPVATSPAAAGGPLPKSNPLSLAGAPRFGGIAPVSAIVLVVVFSSGSVLLAAYSIRRWRTRAVTSMAASARPPKG